MISALFFVWFFAASVWTINALRRPAPPGKRFPPLWLPGMIVSELAPLYLVLRALVAAAFYWLDASALPIGRLGFWLFALSEIGLLVLIWRTFKAASQTQSKTSPLTLFQVWDRLPAGVGKTVEVQYWGDLTLDVYARPGLTGAPTLIYVHPGSWMRGRPGRQARAMFHRLAEEGWVILDIRYPLSPDATFPEHLVGVKRAIAWARDGGSRFGVDPTRIAISGGSSGAHLAALAALTWDHTDLQPGFEGQDTSVMACMPFYGIYDLLVRNPTRYDWPFVARYVMKAHPAEAPDLYKLGSPVDQVRADAPPFHVVHGEFDSIVLASESRHFVDALREAGADVVYHEVRGAQHGFDAIASLRSRSVGAMCAAWLNQMALKA
jgi:acetyl esterase/lipase